MKRQLLLCMFIFCGAVCSADDKIEKLELPSGKVYESVIVTGHNPAWLEIMHKSGAARIKLSACPAEIQQKYGYDAEKATAYLEKESAARRKANARQRQREIEHQKKKQQAKEDDANYQKDQLSEREERDFMRKVDRQAVMLRVRAHQKSNAGLLGDVATGRRTLEAIKGTMVKKKVVWRYGRSVEGIVAGTGHKNQNGSIWWTGKGWAIGSIQYTTVLGVRRTVSYYTASRTQAAAYYRSKIKAETK